MPMTAVLRYLLRRNVAFFVVLAAYGTASWLLYWFGLLHSDVVVTSAIFFIVILGLDLLYGCAGLLSFGHVGFFAIGAYSVAVLHAQFGLGPFVSTACGLAINGAVSYVLGRVCLRLSGSYFMLGTLAFGIMMHGVITVWYSITGGDGGLGGIPRPQIGAVELNSDWSFGLLVWACAAVLFWGSYNLSCSKVGRAARAIRSDEIAAACLGINVPRVKMNLFVISAGFASLGGSLFATYNGAVHPDSFSLGTLLDLLLMLFFGGEGTIWGGLLGTTFMRLLPDIASDLHGAKILFSGVLFTVIILALPRGIAGTINDLIDRLRIRDASPPASAVVGIPFELSRVPSETLLRVENVSRSFGGVRAVEDVTLTVKNGRIKGLIGPNGAGKSTLMNLISGILPIDTGRIVLDGTPLQGLLPHEIAWSGIQRTFQHERLFSHLTIVENIMVGQERGANGSAREFAGCALGLPATLKSEIIARQKAGEWLASLGLSEYADAAIGKVPHGLRKLVEVARACATSPILLLLDETVAGLNDAEGQAFQKVIRALRGKGLTIVIIEHDVDFIMSLCDEICVLNFGKTIADGPPEAIRQDVAVREAYLGA
jgi:ABC-type branched-subunit amino acid transport system ATPase component/ABC-type branched-subunit amino acid transport system permease subunit